MKLTWLSYLIYSLNNYTMKLYIETDLKLDKGKYSKALFRYTKKLKTLQDSTSHRILWHMHRTLNIDKKDN